MQNITKLILLTVMVVLTTFSLVNPASAEYEKVNQYHKIPINSYLFLGSHTTTYLYVGEVDEKIQIHTGFDNKGKPTYKTIHRKGSVYTKNGTIRLAQGTAVQLLSEFEAYHDSALEKETFWKFRDVISGKEYFVKKIGTFMERTVEDQAMLGGYRLNLTYYSFVIHTTVQVPAYTGVTVGNGGHSFSGHKTVTVPQYKVFRYEGVFKSGDKYYVMSASEEDNRVVYIEAKYLKGGQPPVENNTGIIDDNKPDEVIEYTDIKFGQHFVPSERFTAVYAKKNRNELIAPTKLVPNRVYRYSQKLTLAGKEVMQIRDISSSKNLYMYSDKIVKGTFSLVTASPDQKAAELAYNGTVLTKNRLTNYYLAATSSSVTGKATIGQNQKFEITGSKVVGKRTYLQGNLQLTASKTATGVYILPTALHQADITVTYTNNMVLPFRYMKVPAGLKGYSTVKRTKGVVSEGGKVHTTTAYTVYNIKSTRTVGDSIYLGLTSGTDKTTYYFKLDGKQITLKATP